MTDAAAARLSVLLAQMNPTVGDIAGNVELIRRTLDRAQAAGADLVVTPELSICGYPPEDLVYRRAFLEEVERGVEALAEETIGRPAILIGAPWRMELGVVNAVLLLADGGVQAVRAKCHLPNYGVFDEQRVFVPGPLPEPITWKGLRLGVLVCEDMWYPDVAGHLRATGADMLIVPNGSPFEVDKHEVRLNHAVARVSETGLPLVYVNQVGGQDELVFDGGSFVVNADYALAARAARWAEDDLLTQWTKSARFGTWNVDSARIEPQLDRCEEIYNAMVLGTRDYVGKNGFPGVILGLSGGIDSALAAAVAVDALGPEKVRCVMMPSPYTSTHSLEDAGAIAQALGVRYDTVGIGPAMEAFDAMLGGLFGGTAPGITEENIQSRTRGVILMALSNKFGPMVLSTGNKSEMSVGYATLYGDMNGGYNPLKDVYKTDVFAVCRWRNAHKPAGALGPDGPVMPDRVITKPPSAELREDQKDEDSLPPYDVLDAILRGLNEDQKGVRELVADGYDAEVVEKVWTLLNRAEYKRRQAPPGVKITRLAFGRDRRYPITNRYK
ncbi:NAD+ synthase [Caenispirillum bisanense]|uniref:Glutamine-dependent NAD(+) synthetase n=1 Tax=Caenispirillum bisanense TaxID=414052 RepID=A0A286GF32_9PROT|nr:NAD+ synthase [Caenispirillum bisanense]SOD94133.1 NH(3)-dependent NAD(+) synthetase [Caenispirillum bisanense]